MDDLILSDLAEHVCTITLNRPDKRNALTAAMIGTFQHRVEEAARQTDMRVIVIRGEGPAFCAGLDLAELAAQREGGEVEMHTLEHALEALERCPQPTIAAVHGDAVAGGCELALHCDLRVATDTARFSMPLARIGLAVPVALTWKLVDTIGAAATKELLFTGAPVGGDAALALGLVSRVVPAAGLASAVGQLAREIAANAPLSVRAMKAFVQRAVEASRAHRRDDLDRLHAQVRASADAKEGIAAQRERRRPAFRGE